MVRGPYYDKNGIKRGAWSSEEDEKLRAYVERYGHWNWRELPKFAGLARCGKSCRLRWINYLRPDVKRGNYSAEEESLIIKLHEQHGNKWSLIAAQLPGRTDNEVKNHWHTHLKKRSSITSTHDHNQNPTKSQTPQDDLSGESSQCDDTSHNDDEEAANQAESSTTSASATPSTLLCSPQILESSQFSPTDTNASTNSSESSFDRELKPRIDCLGQGDHISSIEACDLEDYYSTGSDFWTEPFMEDKISIMSQTQFEQSNYFGGDIGGILSPYPEPFCDDAMDYCFFAQL